FLIREVFMDSDTHSGVISAVWGLRGQNPSPTAYAAEARELVAALDSPSRLLIQGGVLPNEPGALEFMEVQARDYGVNAWKLYPQWGPDGVGFLMDDPELGLPFLERVRELKVPIVAAHRGLSLSFFRDELESALPLQDKYADPTDIARVAAMYPDITFICYHSGFEPTVVEGPYDPDNPQGMDRFIKAALEKGLQPNRGNLYAELGSLWRDKMGKPDEAAHVMGKLLKYFGEERILWGTDCIWYGSPQDQIMALRAFEISEEFQERYGYPALTPLRKAKIFGLNGAALHNLDVSSMIQARMDDPVGQLRAEYLQQPDPSFLTYGPRTRRDFLTLRNQTRGRPD
ncbi:MAG: amidohydrolase family protein, partial [Gammaproteobacteria bacterium]|nr:amidohydrolase family protein [Gammaproteobacteria bacterium]